MSKVNKILDFFIFDISILRKMKQIKKNILSLQTQNHLDNYNKVYS
jgi:hypothetical protein